MENSYGTKTEITKAILYSMDINCSNNSFSDVGVSTKEFNEFNNKNSKWQDPNGDKLILNLIDQVCIFNNEIKKKA